MNPHLSRALLLTEQNRHELAEQEIRQALAQDPEFGRALGGREPVGVDAVVDHAHEARREREAALHALGVPAAHRHDRVELADVAAVVSDASEFGLDNVVDAAFAGQTADVERE